MYHIAAYIRDILLKGGNAYTSCAACGELPYPPGNRLCVSLKPDWTTDLVLLSGEYPTEAVIAIRRRLPWVRQIHVRPKRPSERLGRGLVTLPEGMEERRLHQADSLAEHFLVLRAAEAPMRPYRQLDFFTPNGIPLVFVRQEEIRIPSPFVRCVASRSKSLSALFAEEAPAAPEEYADAFARWACDKQHAIPAPYPLEEA